MRRSISPEVRLMRRFEDQVDPERVLTPAERERRSVKAFKDYLFERAFGSKRN